MNLENEKLKQFSEQWWKDYVITHYDECGQMKSDFILDRISVVHFVDFLRDAFDELSDI